MKRIDITRRVEYDPLAPIQFLIIFGKEDFVQLNYPEDFLYEESIEELIFPRTPDEIVKVVSQSRLTCTKGGIRFGHNKPEAIKQAIKFNGRAARCGISLGAFQEKVKMKLYNEGLNDSEMGRKLSVVRATIQAWRTRRGLESNFSLNDPRLSEGEEGKRMELYGKGLSNGEIGKKVDRVEGAICAWRKRRKLSPTYVRSNYSNKEMAVLSYLERCGPSTSKEIVASTVCGYYDIQKLLRTLFDKIECVWFKFGIGRRGGPKPHDLFGDLTSTKIFALRDDPRILDYILEKTPLKHLDLDRHIKTSIVQRYGRILDKERAQELVKRAIEFQKIEESGGG